MQNIDPALIQQFLENNSGQNTNGSSNVPTVNIFPQELIDMIAFGIIALTVVSALFFFVYLFGVIRKWRVQSAVLDMQKDIAEIKASLVNESSQKSKIDKDTQKIA